MSTEDLKAQWDAAIAGGDLPTLERLGPQLYPEDGAPPVAPSPSADPPPQLPAVEYARRTRELRDEMLKTNMGSPRMAELQEELDGLYQQRYPEGTPTGPIMTRESARPMLPPGVTWDASLTSAFETTAPSPYILMHTAAEAIRSGERWDDPQATIVALEGRWGADEAEALAADATSYLRAFGTKRIEADLKARGLLYSPRLIRDAALIWRRHRSEQ